MTYPRPVAEAASSESSDAPAWPGPLCAAAGLLSLGLSGAAVLWEFPAWPAASLALLALWASRRPGGALLRAIGAFSALVGLVVATAQIALLYTAGEFLN